MYLLPFFWGGGIIYLILSQCTSECVGKRDEGVVGWLKLHYVREGWVVMRFYLIFFYNYYCSLFDTLKHVILHFMYEMCDINKV